MPVTCTNYKLKCGGCPLLNQPYPDQLKHKQQLEQRLLGRFAPVSPVLGQAEPWHYRNKAIATFATGPRGRLTCGIYAAGTHRVLPYTDCLLQDTVINQTIAAVLEAARACRWPAFEEDRGTGLLRHVLVRRGKTSGQVLVVLVTAQENLPGSRNFVKALREKAPWVTSVVQNCNPRRTSAVLGSDVRTLYGPGKITDTLCGLQFAISPRSFYQVNPEQTEVLYAKAIEESNGKTLYGIGNSSRGKTALPLFIEYLQSIDPSYNMEYDWQQPKNNKIFDQLTADALKPTGTYAMTLIQDGNQIESKMVQPGVLDTFIPKDWADANGTTADAYTGFLPLQTLNKVFMYNNTGSKTYDNCWDFVAEGEHGLFMDIDSEIVGKNFLYMTGRMKVSCLPILS